MMHYSLRLNAELPFQQENEEIATVFAEYSLLLPFPPTPGSEIELDVVAQSPALHYEPIIITLHELFWSMVDNSFHATVTLLDRPAEDSGSIEAFPNKAAALRAAAVYGFVEEKNAPLEACEPAAPTTPSTPEESLPEEPPEVAPEAVLTSEPA